MDNFCACLKYLCIMFLCRGALCKAEAHLHGSHGSAIFGGVGRERYLGQPAAAQGAGAQRGLLRQRVDNSP